MRPPLQRSRSSAPKTKVVPKQESAPSSSQQRLPLLRKQSLLKNLRTPQRKQVFSLLGVKLDPPEARGQKRRRSPSPSQTTSSTHSSTAKKAKAKVLHRRKKRRAKAVVDHALEVSPSSSLSFLEDQAVKAATSKQYQAELKAFLDFAVARGMPLDVKKATDTEVDNLMVEYMNQMYLEGYQSYKADRMIAAFLHEYPNYGRNGGAKIPRTWRCIKGFRKLTPGRSRVGYPFAVWAAYAVEMKKLEKLRMSIFLLLSVSTYARPSELLRARVFSLVRPGHNISKGWSLLLSPEEGPSRTKTGEFDASLLIDSPYLLGWIEKFFECLKMAHPEERLWDFDYEEYQRTFQLIGKMLGMQATPYQTRHSGPSIDRARNYRSQQEVQKRGQWKAAKSVMRYEKSARLAATWDSLPTQVQEYAKACEAELGEILLGQVPAPKFAGVDLKEAM